MERYLYVVFLVLRPTQSVSDDKQQQFSLWIISTPTDQLRSHACVWTVGRKPHRNNINLHTQMKAPANGDSNWEHDCYEETVLITAPPCCSINLSKAFNHQTVFTYSNTVVLDVDYLHFYHLSSSFSKIKQSKKNKY